MADVSRITTGPKSNARARSNLPRLLVSGVSAASGPVSADSDAYLSWVMRTRAISSRSSSSSTRETSRTIASRVAPVAGNRWWWCGPRCTPRPAQHDRFAPVATRESELHVIEQPRLAEPLDEAGDELRPEQVELVHPRRGRDLDPQRAFVDPIGARALRDLRTDQLGPLGDQTIRANLVGDPVEIERTTDRARGGHDFERARDSRSLRFHDARRRRISSRSRRSPSPSRLTKRNPEPPFGT